jgi:hypothetical protein
MDDRRRLWSNTVEHGTLSSEASLLDTRSQEREVYAAEANRDSISASIASPTPIK